jgi:hypothetical protein
MKNIMSDKTYRIVKVVIMIIALVLGFLYVLMDVMYVFLKIVLLIRGQRNIIMYGVMKS